MNVYQLAVVMVIISTLAGCGEGEKSYAEMSEDNIFKGQVDVLERAKGVESTIQSGFDQQLQRANTE